MIEISGLWWPDADRRGRPAIVAGADEAVPIVMHGVEGRKVVVQAGGNVGVYPKALAPLFERVVTFEPDADNMACLLRNMTEDNVAVFHAALSDASGSCSMQVVEPDNCGAHKINVHEKSAYGDCIPVMTIDELELDACDLIWLDIEGHEAKAIDGASKTIARFWPIIVLEEKGLGDRASLPGYEVVGRIGNDTVYRRATC